MRVVPSDLKAVTSLYELYMNHNFIQELPNSLSALQELQLLSLNDNKILNASQIAVIRHFKQLELLDISDNPLKTLPEDVRI